MTHLNRREFVKKAGSMMVMGALSESIFAGSLAFGEHRPTVLITGTSSGFGERMALTFARAGYNTFASMRDPEGKNQRSAQALRSTADREGLTLTILKLDVRKPKEAQEAVAKVIESSGRIDVLINNAGILVYSPIEIVPRQIWELQMETNVYGPMELVGLVMPHMRQQQSGLIIQISSRVGRVVIPGISLYATSKFALEAASEGAHYEATPQGIDFAIIQPSAFDTQVNRNARQLYREFTLPAVEQQRSLGLAFHERFLKTLDTDFQGQPRRDPQELADLALSIAAAPRDQRRLRYPIGDHWEIDPVRDFNERAANMQEEALRGRYEEWYRN